MGILAISGVLLGVILGRVFKPLILVPICWLASVLVLGCLAKVDGSVVDWVLQIAVVTASIQSGYAIGLIVSGASRAPKRPNDTGTQSAQLGVPRLHASQQRLTAGESG